MKNRLIPKTGEELRKVKRNSNWFFFNNNTFSMFNILFDDYL